MHTARFKHKNPRILSTQSTYGFRVVLTLTRGDLLAQQRTVGLSNGSTLLSVRYELDI